MRSFTGPAEKPAAGRIACPTCRGEAALCYKAFLVKKSSPQDLLEGEASNSDEK
jgi:hypothetical protein